MVAVVLKKDAWLDLRTAVQNKKLLAQTELLHGVDMTTFTFMATIFKDS